MILKTHVLLETIKNDKKKKTCTQKPKFDILAKLAKTLLVLPNSNNDQRHKYL